MIGWSVGIMNVNQEICKTFSAQAYQYDTTSRVQQEIGDRLFARLDYLAIKPRYILDLGCGTGIFSKRLKKYYPKATIVGFDLAYTMLRQAKLKQGFRCHWSLINGEMLTMPFASNTFDLIFSNQVLHWSTSLLAAIREINRIMSPDACLMFSTLGPDTFYELREAWAVADGYAHVNSFKDMHDIGDYLLAERLLDPVMDMDMIKVHYSSLTKLLASLKAQGVRNIHPDRPKGLMGKQSWQRFQAAMKVFCTAEGDWPLTYEVLYGHAWKGVQNRTDTVTETFIPLSKLR